jgi:hypothetical protein
VVCEIDTVRPDSASRRDFSRLVLPAPEGAETTKRIPGIGAFRRWG